MTDIRGLLSAVATPFTAGGAAIDEPQLRALVERTIAGGVHGLVPCGSTGEFVAQSDAERRQTVEIVIDAAAGRVPVVPHVGALTTPEAVALAKHAEASGAAGVMVVAPFYEPLDLEETIAYFRAVADAVSVEIMIYNLPVATGVNLEPAVVASLAREVPNITMVKDTSGDMGQATKLIHDFGDVVKTFVGQDNLYFAALAEGGAGSVNGAANFITPQLVAVYDAVQAGRLTDARKIWDEVFPIMQFLVSGGYVAGVKGTFDELGQSIGDPRLPILPLSAERRAEIRTILSNLSVSA